MTISPSFILCLDPDRFEPEKLSQVVTFIIVRILVLYELGLRSSICQAIATHCIKQMLIFVYTICNWRTGSTSTEVCPWKRRHRKHNKIMMVLEVDVVNVSNDSAPTARKPRAAVVPSNRKGVYLLVVESLSAEFTSPSKQQPVHQTVAMDVCLLCIQVTSLQDLNTSD